ncbi:hypothetical protein H2199_000126 [Coniosporium tulheliwenetii]|uniref:Uncharacterized protein n=1 Tax=Coniosporium tulheliwenetii TaxID=3383036 RepID=A0ACC2ZP60_9PEZI|nr:hypothetical protein H2199_000126 [Cladosporium sp. JES 115]
MDAFYLIFKLICELSFSHLFAVAFLLLALGICTYFVTFTPPGESEGSSHGISGSDQSVIDFLHEEHGPVVCVAPGWYSIGDPEAAAALLNTFTPKVGQSFGFLGSDDGNVQGLIERLAKWNAAVPSHGLPAFMRRLAFLLGNLPTDPDYLESFVVVQLQQRLSHQIDTDYADVCDVLEKCVDKAGTDDLHSIVIACAANIVASSTATAMGIKSALFHIYTNWRVLDNVRRELKAKEREGSLSDIITLQEAEKLPYLQAALKEAVRLHTVSGLPSHVIETDEIIKGHEIPRGSKISISSAAIYRNKSIFGDDSSTFRPERWLAVTPECLELMNSYVRQFGGDTLDLNLAGMVKVIPQIIRRFHLELERGVSREGFGLLASKTSYARSKYGALRWPSIMATMTANRTTTVTITVSDRVRISRSSQWNNSPTVAKDDVSPKAVPNPQRLSGLAPVPNAAEKLSAWNALPTELKVTEGAVAAARWQEILAGQPKVENPAAIEEIFKPWKDSRVLTTKSVVDLKENVQQHEKNDVQASENVATMVEASVPN